MIISTPALPITFCSKFLRLINSDHLAVSDFLEVSTPCNIVYPSIPARMIDTSSQQTGRPNTRSFYLVPSPHDTNINSTRNNNSNNNSNNNNNNESSSNNNYNNNNNNDTINHNNNNNKSSSSSSRCDEKYGLRPRGLTKRLQQGHAHQQVPKGSQGVGRPKSRPAPLSKYRRKTANARERHRMQEINNAFESLRRVLPDKLEIEEASSNMTKITTLRLATNYIRTLSGVLGEEGGEELCSLQYSTPTSILRVAPPHHHHHHLLDYFSPASHIAVSGSQGSLSTSSCSDLDDLLSDDSCSLLDDNFDVFHDIPSLSLPDPLEFLLAEERDAFAFNKLLCN